MAKTILGKIYVGDNQTVFFAVCEDSTSEIFLMDGRCQYRLLLDDRGSSKKLNFDVHHQITGIYRLRRGCEKTVYFTDNYNPPRYLNISDVDSFKEIIDTEPLVRYGATDADKMRLQKTYDMTPRIGVEIVQDGQLLAGSYNIAVRYVDDDLNPSEWIYATEPVMIWHDNSNDYNSVRATSNNDVEYRKYGPTTKAIRVSVRNRQCDHSFTFVQFALIGANSGTGFVNDVVYSPLQELDFGRLQSNLLNDTSIVYTFTGGTDVTTGSEDEILANTEIFDRVKCLEQADNRLVMGNVTDMDVDWCKLQKYASRITADCVWKKITVDSMTDGGQKDPLVLYNNNVGYQPGEIYSFGIVYVFENGAKSPVYHIPGKSPSAGANDIYSSGNVLPMSKDNRCDNARYSDVSTACDGFKYWGHDNCGSPINGEMIRHHRFPLTTETTCFMNSYKVMKRGYMVHYNMIVGIVKGRGILGRFKQNFDTIYIKYSLEAYDNRTDREGTDVGEFDILARYDEFTSMYKKLEISYGRADLIIRKGYPYSSVISDPDKRNHINDAAYHNGGCSNGAGTEGGFRLRPNKQRRYVNVYEYDAEEYDSVMFRHLQEYPQYRPGDVTTNTRPLYLSTGGVLTYKNFGYRNEKKRSYINDKFEELGDDFFFDKVSLEAPRRTRAIIDNIPENEDEEGDNRNLHFIERDEDEVAKNLMRTNVGFYIEPRIEISEERNGSTDKVILGIRFSNVEMPDDAYLNGHKVVGYIIVQNERTDENATVIDSAVLTPLFVENSRGSNNFDSGTIVSSRLFPNSQQHATAQNMTAHDVTSFCHEQANLPSEDQDNYDYIVYWNPNRQYSPSIKDSNLVNQKLYKHAVGMINPEFKFNRKEYYNFSFRRTGYFRFLYARYSTDYNEAWVTQDVQAGSSYNKKINSAKDRDNDGFDLHVFHKNSFVQFVPDMSDSVKNFDNDDIHYIAPSSYIDKECKLWTTNEAAKSRHVINMSGDNSMAFLFYGDDEDITDMFTDGANNKIVRLPYGYLIKRVADPYANFSVLPYYPVSDVFYFKNEAGKPNAAPDVFRGDCFVSPMKYTTGSLYDIRMKKRARKQTWWQYVVGANLIAGGIVGSIWTGGATAALIGPGISMIQNGIRTDVAIKNQKLFQQKNCKRALSDTWVNYFINRDQEDDEIQWLFESVDCLWFESRLNINWRVGTSLNDVSDYLDPLKGYNGSDLRYYFTKKLTYPDKDHSDGRMYYGFAQAEIYDINKDFQRRNRQKAYYCLPVTYECCSECQNSFPKRLVYSQMSFAEEKTDNFKVFLPGNYKDVPGETGDITNVSYQGQDAFMVFTEEGLWQLAPQRQQQVNQITQVVSFIGTGDFFSGEPQRFMKNDANITFGSRHQNSFVNTPYGTFWYSEHDNAIYTFADKQPMNIFKQAGMGKFFERNGRIKMDMEYYDAYRIDFPYKDNPSYEYGTGYVMGWDNRYERLLITKKDNVVPVQSDSCALDSKARILAEGVVADKVDELVSNGAVNICYRWDQRKCGFEIEYDTIESHAGTVEHIIPILSHSEEYDFHIVVFIDMDVRYRREGNIVGFNIDDFLPQYFEGLPSDRMHIYINYRDGVSPHDFGGYSVDTTYTGITDFILNYDPMNDGIFPHNKLLLLTITNSVDVDGLFPYHASVLTKLHQWNTDYRFKYYAFPIYYRTRPSDMAPYDDTLAKMELYFTAKGVYENNAPKIALPGGSFPLFSTSLVSEYVYSESDLLHLYCEQGCGNIGSNLNDYTDELDSISEKASELFDSINETEVVTNDTFEDLAKLYELLSVYLHYNDIKNSYDYSVSPGDANGYHNFYCYKDISAISAFLIQNGIDPCDGNDHSGFYSGTMEPAITGGRYVFADDISLSFGGTAYTFTTDSDILSFIHLVWQHLWDVIGGYTDYVDNNGNDISNSGVAVDVYENSRATRKIDEEEELVRNIGSADVDVLRTVLHNDNVLVDTDIDEISYISGMCYIGRPSEERPVHNLDLLSLAESLFADEGGSYEIAEVAVNGSFASAVFTHHTEYVYLDGEPAEDFDDIDKRCSEDNSFTISFKPGVGFVSFHSYRPDMYLWTADDLFSWRNGSNRIYRHNVEGSYQNFYGDTYPFVVEVVDRNPNTVYGPQVMDSISMMVKADRYVDGSFNEERNVFFGKAYFYNSMQCSLVHDIVAKGGLSSSNYFDEYLSNEMDRFKISAERRESLWHINGLRNYRIDYQHPMHLYDIGSREAFMADMQMNGWIDKALDESLLDADKNWWDVEPFRDNFLCQRYFYNPDDENIRLKVMLSTTAKSQSVDNVLK